MKQPGTPGRRRTDQDDLYPEALANRAASRNHRGGYDSPPSRHRSSAPQPRFRTFRSMAELRSISPALYLQMRRLRIGIANPEKRMRSLAASQSDIRTKPNPLAAPERKP